MDNDQRAQVGARIIAARGSQGLSQEELSSRAGITANTLRRIERGALTAAHHIERDRRKAGAEGGHNAQR